MESGFFVGEVCEGSLLEALFIGSKSEQLADGLLGLKANQA